MLSLLFSEQTFARIFLALVVTLSIKMIRSFKETISLSLISSKCVESADSRSTSHNNKVNIDEETRKKALLICFKRKKGKTSYFRTIMLLYIICNIVTLSTAQLTVSSLFHNALSRFRMFSPTHRYITISCI